MKKRSKLDLNPEAKQDKSPAAGFDLDSAEEPQPQPQPKAQPEAQLKSKPKPKPRPKQRQAGNDAPRSRPSVPSRSARPSRALIIMSAALVAVVAVSLLMLKRR